MASSLLFTALATALRASTPVSQSRCSLVQVVLVPACLLCCTQAAWVPCLVQVSASSACCCSAPEEAPLEIVQLVDRCLDRNPALRPDALKVIQTISASLYRSAQALTAVCCSGNRNMSASHHALARQACLSTASKSGLLSLWASPASGRTTTCSRHAGCT